MTLHGLVPWSGSEPAPRRSRREGDPFTTLRREMDRLIDDAFRGFDLSPFGGTSLTTVWPSLEMTETDQEVRVSAELPGLDEKDVEVLMSDGVLIIRGEKKSEADDKGRAFSERFYGRFERRIPLAFAVEEDKVEASFRNGVLTITLPKSAQAAAQAKRIAITAESKH